jgi:hypothetical protein
MVVASPAPVSAPWARADRQLTSMAAVRGRMRVGTGERREIARQAHRDRIDLVEVVFELAMGDADAAGVGGVLAITSSSE